MRTTTSAIALVAALAACDPSDRLLVDVRSDLVPGVEVDALRVVVGAAGVEEREVGSGDDLLGGVRAADLSVSGEVSFRVQALRSGRVLLDRPVVAAVRGLHAVTVLLSRDCRGVACPALDGDPSAIACLGGTCVDSACTEDEASCEPECAVDADCAASSACAIARCVASTCVAAPGACGPAERCDLDFGCVPAAAEGGYRRLVLAQVIGLISDGRETVVAGQVPAVDGPDGDFMMMRLDVDGRVAQAIRADAGGDDTAFHVARRGAEAYVLAGNRRTGTNVDAALTTFDGAGARIGQLNLGTAFDESFSASVESTAGTLWAVGRHATESDPGDFLVVTQRPGTMSIQVLGGPGLDTASAVTATATGVVVAGSTTSFGESSALLIRYRDSDTSRIDWATLLGDRLFEPDVFGVDVAAVGEDDVVVVATTLDAPRPEIESAVTVTRIGPDGGTRWSRSLGLAPTLRTPRVAVGPGEELAVTAVGEIAGVLTAVLVRMSAVTGRLRGAFAIGEAADGIFPPTPTFTADGVLTLAVPDVSGRTALIRLPPGGDVMGCAELEAIAVALDEHPGEARDVTAMLRILPPAFDASPPAGASAPFEAAPALEACP